MKRLEPTTGFVPIGGLFVCNCGIPLAKKIGASEYKFIKFYDGKQVSMDIKLGDFTEVKCPKCSRGFSYVRVKEKIGAVDNIDVVAKPKDAKLKK